MAGAAQIRQYTVLYMLIWGKEQSDTMRQPTRQPTPTTTARLPHASIGGRLAHTLGKLALLLLAVLLFVLALQLLKAGSGSMAVLLRETLQVGTAGSTLGLGWLLAYGFLSGSPVAALAVTLFAAGTLDALQTLTMLTGSRLGAAAVVLLIGAVAGVRQRQSAPLAVGVLALLATAAIYLPALLPGYLLLTSGVLAGLQVGSAALLISPLQRMIEPLLALLTATLPDWLLVVGGILSLLASLHLFERALPAATSIAVPAQHRATALLLHPVGLFVLGGAVTLATLSVSVSLGVLVPLASSGRIQPRHMLPYIMGANITTFVDTLVAALLVGGTAAFTIVLIELLSVALLSLFVLLCCYRTFERALLAAQAWVTAQPHHTGLFVVGLVLLPVLLLLG